MTEIEFTSEISCQLVKSDFDDHWPVVAARTSTAGANASADVKSGLINRLVKDRHGSPFEHMNATWIVRAPLMIWREHHRHRIASYNEESGRYKKLEPLFYSCPPERPLQTVEGSKQMDYEYAPGTPEQRVLLRATEIETCTLAYQVYERRLAAGIIKEVARKDLPLSIMSTCVVTMNARALMNFLSLRTRHEDALHASKPQWEINQLALRYEDDFAALAPRTWEAFCDNGRVAP